MAAAPRSDDDRYLVVSADHHAGADVQDYKPYLAAEWHDEFDAWAAEVTDRWNAANEGRDNERSWHSARRLEEDDADGIAGEVLFPNTLPPFYPKNDLTSSLPRTQKEYEQRFAGLRAHNRWTVDFIAQAPVRRRGPVQILLNDVDDAVAEIKWGHEHGLTAVLIPAPSPNHPLEGLWSRRYDPIWALAEELGMPINQHSGAGAPEVGTDPAELACWQFDLRPLCAPHAVESRLRGRVRALPEPALHHDRRRCRLGPGLHGPLRPAFSTALRPEHAIQSRVRSGRRPADHAAERVHQAQLLRHDLRCRADRRDRDSSQDRLGPPDVGLGLPARRRQLPAQQRGAARLLPAMCRSTSAATSSVSPRPSSTASMSRSSTRSRNASGRRLRRSTLPSSATRRDRHCTSSSVTFP